jgi:hypothetical protein
MGGFTFMKRRFLFLFAIVAVLLGFAQPVFAGFGITPPYVRSEALTRGSHYTQEIILVRGDPVEDLQAEVTINVPGISDWFSVDKGMTFPLPKGQSQVPIHISVDVPGNAAYAAYSGNIRIRTVSAAGPTSGVSIALGAQIDVSLKVVDKIEDFEVRRVELSESEEGHSFAWLNFPGRINFGLHIENTGNVAGAPSKVHMDIYNRDGTELLSAVDNIGSIQKIEPFTTTKVVATLPNWLPPGGYLVRYTVYKEDTVKKTGELTLSVLPRGTIPNTAGIGFVGLSLGDKLSVILPIVFLMLGLVGVALFFFGNMRRPSKRSRPPRESRVSRDPPPPPSQDISSSDQEEDEPPSPPRAPEPSPPPASSPRRPVHTGGVVDLSGKKRIR